MENARYERLNALLERVRVINSEIKALSETAGAEYKERRDADVPNLEIDLKIAEWRSVEKADEACNELLHQLSNFRWHRDWDILFKDTPNSETDRMTRLGFDADEVAYYESTRPKP